MSISFDKALGVHQHAVKLRSQRAEILANNLANADTPGFKAKDLDFKEILMNDGQGQLKVTDSRHIPLSPMSEENALYRVPMQPSIDGNTVEEQVEIAKFSENSMQYLASLRFLDGKFKGLMTAIRGE